MRQLLLFLCGRFFCLFLCRHVYWPPGTFSLEGFGFGPIYLSRPTNWASSLYDTRYCGVLL